MEDYKKIKNGALVYNVEKPLSYSAAKIHIIISGRRAGKTYGFKIKALGSCIKKGTRFALVYRTKSDLNAYAQDEFGKIEAEGNMPDDCHIEYKNKRFYRVWHDDEGNVDKEQGKELMGYAVSLSGEQQDKRGNYALVDWIIFDEAIIDRIQHPNTRYQPNEFTTFAGLIASLTGETPYNPYKGKIILLGNACDMLCPYIQELGLLEPPEYGIKYYKNKLYCLHYVEPWDEQQRRTKTVVGRMLDGHDEAETFFANKFKEAEHRDFIAKKPAHANCMYGIEYMDIRIAIWFDLEKGMAYLTNGIPTGIKRFALTTRDMKIDNTTAKRAKRNIEVLIDMFYNNCLRYDSTVTREQFYRVLKFYGIG